MATRETLDFIQIIYDDEQISELYPFAAYYKNESLTPYFENSVIKDLVPALESDLISICSWRLKKKRNDMWRLTDKTLTKEKILQSDFDIAILTPRSASHQALLMASNWHGESWDKAIADLRNFIKVPKEVTHAIYENHFIATKEIYHEYINNCLRPAIDFMSDRSVFFSNANYINRKRGTEREKIYQILKEKLGRNDYPIAPFILERLFSIWIEGKGFKIINL
jgi:hypothetical protein